MEQNIITRRYIVWYFLLFLLTACGGGNVFIPESKKRGSGMIETVNPEGSTAHRLYSEDFKAQEGWV